MTRTYNTKPRFETNLPIQISGGSNIKGFVLNLSRTGAKICLDQKYKCATNSFVCFYIYMDGSQPMGISFSDIYSIGKNNATFEEQSHRIKIVGKIIRPAREEGGNCWGVEIVQPEGSEKVKFHRLLTELEQKNTQEIAASQGKALSRQGTGFTLKFRSVRDLVDFLPDDLYSTFFIPTIQQRDVASRIAMVLVHPVYDTRLQFTVTIEDYGYPLGGNTMGATCSFETVDLEMIKSLNTFIGLKLY